MSDTPETDAQVVKDVDVKIHDLPDGTVALKTRGGFVPADFARKLERERDETQNNAHNYKEGFHIQSLRAEQAERERDKWREYAERLIAEEFERLKEASK